VFKKKYNSFSTKVIFAFLLIATFLESFIGMSCFKNIKLGDLLLSLLAIVFFSSFIIGNKIKKPLDISILFLVSFFFLIIAYLFNIFFSRCLKQDTLEMIKTSVSIYGILFFYIIAVKNNIELKKVAFAFVLSVCVNAFLGVLETLGYDIINIFHSDSISGGYTLTGRAEGLTMHPNFFGLLCGMAIPLVISLDTYFLKSYIIKISTLLLLLYGVIISGSRSAMVATIICTGLGMLYMCKNIPRKNIKNTLAIGLFGCIGFAATLFKNDIYDKKTSAIYRIIGSGDANISQSSSDEQRKLIMAESLINIEEHPIVGNGMKLIEHAHCIYIQFIESAGLFGFLSLMSYILFFVIGGIQTIKKGDVFGIGLLTSSFIFFTNGIFSNIVYTRPVLLPLFMFAAYLNLENRKINEI
jgi:O-antigen ligase